jgi:hypothetical protein
MWRVWVASLIINGFRITLIDLLDTQKSYLWPNTTLTNCSTRKSLYTIQFWTLDPGHSETRLYSGILRMLWMLPLESFECSLPSFEVSSSWRDREHLLKEFSMLSLLWKCIFDSRYLGNVSISRWPRNAFKGALCRIHVYWPNPILWLSGSMSQYFQKFHHQY